MSNNTHQYNNLLLGIRSRRFLHWLTITVAAFVVIVGLFIGGVYVWAQSYEERIPPNIFVADVALGGLDPEQARQLLQEDVDEILTTGIEVIVDGEQKTLTFVTLVGTDLIEDIQFDLDSAIENLLSLHRENSLEDSFTMFGLLFKRAEASVPFELNQNTIKETVLALFPEAESLSENATFVFFETDQGWTAQAQEGIAGQELQWDVFFDQLTTQLSVLDSSSIKIALLDQEPRISLDEANNQIEQALSVVNAAPYEITYSQDGISWALSSFELLDLVVPGEETEIAINEDAYLLWIERVLQDVNIQSQDARLVIEDGRVTEFVESRNGVTVDVDETYDLLVSAVQTISENPIEIVVDIEEPTVTTSDVNDLGITEILGSGGSNYRGSPLNRRINIQNGVDLLNGLLIAPGETFSLIEALRPFEYDNGYLPELVIKGDKIEAEMGGGLCQIGTTTFRAVMNSGLKVIERRNHSLVVSYYNDPANGNPGTDATLYEPNPDFKFLNDTDDYILFQAENLTETSDLRFTFWGTSDGRKGSYEPPTVTRWIPVGETVYTETTDLEPGEEQCQEAHIGADAFFTYTVMHPDGEIEETVYESHYRPLPKICLVGVEEKVEEDEDVQDVEEVETSDLE